MHKPTTEIGAVEGRIELTGGKILASDVRGIVTSKQFPTTSHRSVLVCAYLSGPSPQRASFPIPPVLLDHG
jgi:hypothetical protein